VCVDQFDKHRPALRFEGLVQVRGERFTICPDKPSSSSPSPRRRDVRLRDTFDIVGARAVGLDGAYLNRHNSPYGGWPQQPTVEVGTADGLDEALL
jgi:hypothetical protein